MTRMAHLLCIAVLACGLAVAGCGGDDDGGGGGDSGQGQSNGGGSSDPRVQQGVESCKQNADNAAGISDEVKQDLKRICEKAASGDADSVREATREVCAKIVEETVPAGPARDQAVEACQGGQSQ